MNLEWSDRKHSMAVGGDRRVDRNPPEELSTESRRAPTVTRHVGPTRASATLDSRVEDDIRLATQLDVPVLVTAGNDDQREMCARLIHARGDRARGPFVAFSGRGAGASAGDSREAPGVHDGSDAVLLRHLFEQARAGTLFIHDVALLTADAQVQLLSLLDERVAPYAHPNEAARLGVRIIAGASRQLDAERATGVFGAQLFYRLNVIHIDVIDRHAREKDGHDNPS